MKKLILLAVFFALLGREACAYGNAPKAVSPEGPVQTSEAQAEIFVTSWCPYCSKLEAFLKKNDVSFTRYDIEKDAQGAQIFDAIGGTGVPVTRVGRKVIHGYDPESILTAVREQS